MSANKPLGWRHRMTCARLADQHLHRIGRSRIEHGHGRNRNSVLQPAGQHGAAHMPAPTKNDVPEHGLVNAQASPTVSNSTASMALLASMPDPHDEMEGLIIGFAGIDR